MKHHNEPDENKAEVKEAPVVKMETKEVRVEKTLLPKKEISIRKERSLRI